MLTKSEPQKYFGLFLAAPYARDIRFSMIQVAVKVLVPAKTQQNDNLLFFVCSIRQ